MEGLEGRPTFLVHGHDLAVEEHGLGLEPRDLSCDRGVEARGVPQVPGEQVDALAILDRQGSVAVELHLIGPTGTLRQLRAELANIGERVGGALSVSTLPGENDPDKSRTMHDGAWSGESRSYCSGMATRTSTRSLRLLHDWVSVAVTTARPLLTAVTRPLADTWATRTSEERHLIFDVETETGSAPAD